MTSLVSFLDDAPLNNSFGRVTGSASDTVFSSAPALQAKFKASSDNIGSFFLGTLNTTFWELDAGQETDWIPINDLGSFYYRNPSGTSDTLSYWLQS